MAWALMLHVEPGPELIACGEAPAGKRAYVWLYLRDVHQQELAAAVEDACDTWGVACLDVCETRRVDDGEVPAEVKATFDGAGIGFGAFHSYPVDAPDA